MVTITNYSVSENANGKKIYTLTLRGDIELVKSKETEKFYTTVRYAFITSTIDEVVCKGLIGETMKGSIVNEQCEAYDYVLK